MGVVIATRACFPFVPLLLGLLLLLLAGSFSECKSTRHGSVGANQANSGIDSRREPAHARAPRTDGLAGDAIKEAAGEVGEGPADEQLDAASDESFSASAGSRSVGGEPVGKPPNWLATSWFQKPGKNHFDLFGGMLIRLNDHHVLAHKESCNRTDDDYKNLDGDERRAAHDTIGLLMPAEIDTTQPMGYRRLFGCDVEGATYLPEDMGVFKLSHSRHWQSYTEMLGLARLFHRPLLQSDPSVKDDCFLYSYSGNSSGAVFFSGNKRKYTKFRVDYDECTGSVCSFTSSNYYGAPESHKEFGGVCSKYQDAGAPILCGADQKLSYVIIPQEKDLNSCDRFLSALRLADHYDLLNKFIQNNNTMPRPPNVPTINCDVGGWFDLFQGTCPAP